MKVLFSVSFLILLCCPVQGRWHNGPKTQDINHPFFGGHDWIAWKAYKLAFQDADLTFIKDNQMIFFYGTEAPDDALLPGIEPIGSYNDQTQCHCIAFDEGGVLKRDRAAVRVSEEFEKAKEALERGDERLAAFYVGALAHYLGDLGQYMHLMVSDSHWPQEQQALHSSYEAALDKHMDVVQRTSFLETYVKRKSVSGTNPRDITLGVARFVERGGNTIRNPGWMNAEYETYAPVHGKRGNPGRWGKKFLDQSGANVNQAINGIAKLYRMLGEDSQ